ncbi:MAG: peptidase S41 [Pedobacter sp.]|nr:MAG: peptidase S41 [Pedobacter sp.]
MKILFYIISMFFVQFAYAQTDFNGGFEQQIMGKPKNWILNYAVNQDQGYKTIIDSTEKRTGKYSMLIEKISDKATYAAVGWATNQSYDGKVVEVTGYIKTKDITKGNAGLWMRVEGREGSLVAEFMEKQGPKGTTDWKKYQISFKYPKDDVVSISVGGILMGNGKAWFDDLELTIDGKPIAQSKSYKYVGRQTDTTFNKSSQISLSNASSQQITNLALAGQFWGFLKYHHPAVAKGDYFWDSELFRILPDVITAKNDQELSRVLEKYLDSLPKPQPCKSCNKKIEKQIGLMPDYGDLMNEKIVSKSLAEKLNYIKENRFQGDSYYVGTTGVGNPEFKNERAYADMLYPDAGYRLLTLYRYWAMINYFFPYKHQTDENWNDVLKQSIPVFLAAKNEKQYAVAALGLIAKVNDTHANLWGNNRGLSYFRGTLRAPFEAKFIEDKLVVTAILADTLNISDKVKKGDIIETINGKSVNDLVKQLLPFTPASNYETQLRDLPNSFLLKSNEQLVTMTLLRNNVAQDVKIPMVSAKTKFIDLNKNIKGYDLINNDISYVYPAKYKNTDLPAIKKLFSNAKAMVIDMRCYPSDFMPFTFGSYIKKENSPFVKFTKGDASNPGLFTFTPAIKNGGGGEFKGNVIVIVNATSQSNAEYTTMAFQSAPNVKVLGSITAGADGNVSTIILPGGLSSWISGIGVFYPDGTPTQRVGVKIDYPLHPTLKGLNEGKDELLEKAIEILREGW